MLTLHFKDIEDRKALYQSKSNANFRIILAVNTKCHILHKDLLLRSSFINRYITNDKTKDCNVLYITKKIDPHFFEQVLSAFYGHSIVVEDGLELYRLYEILQYLQIAELQQQVHEFLLRDYSCILIGYQISELYAIESLSNYYFKYFQNNGFSWLLNETHDLEKLRKELRLAKTKQQPLAPSNYLLLEEQSFKKLLYLHNSLFKQDDVRFLTQFQLARKIKDYCLVNCLDKINLKEFFQDIIQKKYLTKEEEITILSEFQSESNTIFKTTTNSINISVSEHMNDSLCEDFQDILAEAEANKLHTPPLLTDSEAHKNQMKLCESLKPILLYESSTVDNGFLVGLSNLMFQIQTQYTIFGFYISVKVEFGKFLDDPELELVNLQTKYKVRKHLKVNRIKFEENSININNRVIVTHESGTSRYDEELDEALLSKEALAGSRTFNVRCIQVLNIINNPFQ